MMNPNTQQAVVVMALAVLLVACGREAAMTELSAYVDTRLQQPAGEIEPLPEFFSYDPFTYSAASLRSPFVSPAEMADGRRADTPSEVRPDQSRRREALEQFSLSSLRMVGSITRGGQRWALVRDPESVVHRVATGQYLGRNHGRVTAVSEQRIGLIEIVPSGQHERWIERPQSLRLEGSREEAESMSGATSL